MTAIEVAAEAVEVDTVFSNDDAFFGIATTPNVPKQFDYDNDDDEDYENNPHYDTGTRQAQKVSAHRPLFCRNLTYAQACSINLWGNQSSGRIGRMKPGSGLPPVGIVWKHSLVAER